MAAETIHALATVPGKSGVAVIRLSGGNAWKIVERLTGSVPPVRRASLRVLRGPDGSVLDEALILCFREGESFTGEEAAELQLHGSIAVIDAVLSAIAATELARPANPGEFTRRALTNDRLDLTQVQGLADIIDAETEVQRTAAMRVMRGELSERVLSWRDTLLRATALIEATIDFADEDVPVDVMPEVRALLVGLSASIQEELAGSGARRRLRSGFDVAIVGAPNVGKSSLLNALARNEAAIVSDRPGTTRDLIEKYISINGLPVNLIDTAGLRDADDDVEKIGIARAVARAESADLRIFLYDGDSAPEWPIAVQTGDLILRSKADLGEGGQISSRTGEGLEGLERDIEKRLWSADAGGGLIARQRDVELSEGAWAIIDNLLDDEDWQVEIAAENLRRATSKLEAIVGGVEVEDVLGEIFASFCIGK